METPQPAIATLESLLRDYEAEETALAQELEDRLRGVREKKAALAIVLGDLKAKASCSSPADGNGNGAAPLTIGDRCEGEILAARRSLNAPTIRKLLLDRGVDIPIANIASALTRGAKRGRFGHRKRGYYYVKEKKEAKATTSS